MTYDVEIKQVNYDGIKKTLVNCYFVPESVVLALIEKYGNAGNCFDIVGLNIVKEKDDA